MESKVLEIIRKRRSIRAYRPDPIPDELLSIVLEAARLAPSARNDQPWHFIVVTDEKMKELKQDIVKTLLDVIKKF